MKRFYFFLAPGDELAFAKMTRSFHQESNPFNARRLVQAQGDRKAVFNPPCLPLDEARMDAIYDLPYTRRPHPRYDEQIPAFEMIKDSIEIMRGCFGGCTFCSITTHEGRVIQSRSRRSILAEVARVAKDPELKGTISDLGGPTANMYQTRCARPEIEARCRRLSCIHPTICILLGTDHGPTIDLMRAARAVEGVKRVNIASGIRVDLANLDDRHIDELAAHHVGGHLKVAPEQRSDAVLGLMKKPSSQAFETFAKKLERASAKAGKEQYLVPYFIASHPGSGVDEMIDLAVFLKAHGYKPRQVRDSMPAPMDIASCMCWTGLDPQTLQPVETVTKLHDRRIQRSLMRFFGPENWFAVHRALTETGRRDLIGGGPQSLIPRNPPREALEARRREARETTYVHAEDAGTSGTLASAETSARSKARGGAGYRPGQAGHGDVARAELRPARA